MFDASHLLVKKTSTGQSELRFPFYIELSRYATVVV